MGKKRYCKYKSRVCICYDNEIEAQIVLLKSKREQGKNKFAHIPKRVYKCKCGSWHLTSKEGNMNGEYFSEKYIKKQGGINDKETITC